MELTSSSFRGTSGAVAADWQIRTVKQIGTVVRGASPRPAGDRRYFDGSYIPWLTVAALTNIPSSQLDVIETYSFLTREGAQQSRILEPGTVIIANSGATLGVAKIVRIRCCANDGIAALLNLETDINARYVAHFINSKLQFLRDVVATGNGQPNLNTQLIGDLVIPFPPTKAEQDAIAGALSDTDRLIESLEQLISKKRLIKQGAMQELLTGKKRMPGSSGSWSIMTLGNLFSFSGGFAASRSELSHQGHCYLHYGDIHKATKTFVDVRAEYLDIPKLSIPLNRVTPASMISDGDVVFVDASEDLEGASKHVVIVNPDGIPYIAGLHTIVAKQRNGMLDNDYQRCCFQTRGIKAQFRFYTVGTKVSGISKRNIAKVTMPVPPLREQIAIAEVLCDVDAEIEALEAKLAKTRLIKQGMMQELLTGKTRLV